MLGNSTIQQYFASGDTHYVTPQVSFEWNYNLFYAPYVTSNGSYTPTPISGTWVNPPSVSSNGRSTSVFLNDSGQSTRSCSLFSTTTGAGDSSIVLPLTSTSNTYKITFYAKVDRDAVVNLSALAYIDYHRAHSSSQQIDNITWTKFEIYLSPQPLNTPYSNPTLFLHHGNMDGTAAYGILIDQLEYHQTTDFEYKYGNLWSTSAPFNSHRPGESYVPSGNSLCQLPSNFRQIKTDIGVDQGSTIVGTSIWNNQYMPVSPVVYHPSLLGTNTFNPVYKNGSLSEWSKYKYFVADTSSAVLSASYDQTLNVNKIVIKFNLAYSTPSSFTVVLNGSTQTYAGGYSSAYNYSNTYSNADIDASGTCILYYQSNGTWVSGKANGAWVGTVDTTTVPGTPSFDINGNISFGGSKGGLTAATVAINSVQLTQNSATVNSSYSATVNENFGSNAGYADKTNEFKRMQVVEISPRLEVDTSYFVMSVQTQAELDNKQNPLPISQISSNMATVILSNIPLVVSSTIVSLFSNNSSNSVLKGLFKNYVKCYINYRILDTVATSSNSDHVIPGGVFYVDSWNSTDISKTVVTAYDISKYLQLVSPVDYVSQTENAFRLISNILDFAGFTDYDYDSLKKVTSSTHVTSTGVQKSSTAPLKIAYFYVDGTQQKVFDVLREIFEAYQIAAYVDNYGILKFINVDGIFDSSNKIATQLHDVTAGVSVTTANGYLNNLTISPNIVFDNYKENIKTKVGKATLKYKSPQIQRTIASDTRLTDNNLYVNYAPTFMDSTNAIWDSSIDEAVTFNTLSSTMKKSDTFFIVPKNEAIAGSTAAPVFRTYSIDHDGYGIIEDEIVSFQYKEFSYTNNQGFSQTRSVLNSSDFAAQFAEVSTLANNQDFKVEATGRITNVKRGQFNTPVGTHTVMSSLSDIQSRFNVPGSIIQPSITNGHILLSSANGSSSVITCIDSYSPNNYQTFSTKVLAGPNSGTSHPDNTSYGLYLSGSSQTYVYLTQQMDGNILRYYLYVHQGGFKGRSLLTTPYVDVTSIVNSYAKYPLNSPLESYSKNLNIKFVIGSGTSKNAFEVYLNKTHVPLSTVSGVSVDASGSFGIFVNGTNSKASSIQFSEVYATQSALLDANMFYHYHMPWFAEKLSSNKKIFEISYMVQAAPKIVGINYYDIKDTQAPSFDAYPLKLSYDWYYLVNGNSPDVSSANSYSPLPYSTEVINGQVKNVPVTGNIPNLKKIPIHENSLNYSPIYHSGFRSRFAIINGSPSQVWIRKSPDSVNKINIDFSLITRSLITLGSDVVVEKVFDTANINETVDITSNWIQDKNTATSILRTISRALEGFSKDTIITVYGNPLFEIGDIVVINYSLKNIINQKFFVQGVSQSFDTGLVTTLVLNKIADNAIVTSATNYIAPLQSQSILNPIAPISPPLPNNTVSGSTGSIIGNLLSGSLLSLTGIINPTGYSSPTNYQWQNSSSPASGFQNISGATSSTYTLQNSDQALYIRCTVIWGSGPTAVLASTGSVGTVASSVVITAASTQNGAYGFTTTWSATGSGIDHYSVSWTNTNGDSGTTSPATSPYTHTPISNYQSWGVYTITVSSYSSAGTIFPSATATLIQKTEPLIPTAPTVNISSVTTSGFTASWSATNISSYQVILYQIIVGRYFTVSPTPYFTTATSKVFTGLSHGSNYQLVVAGINGIINGPSTSSNVNP